MEKIKKRLSNARLNLPEILETPLSSTYQKFKQPLNFSRNKVKPEPMESVFITVATLVHVLGIEECGQAFVRCRDEVFINKSSDLPRPGGVIIMPFICPIGTPSK